MNHALRSGMALVAIALAGLAAQGAHAQLTYSNQTESFTLSTSDLTFGDIAVDHNVNYQVNGANGATDNPTLTIYGDVNSFTWTSTGGTSISGLSTSAIAGTATATLTSNGTTGTATYDYTSHNGDGIVFVGVNPANNQIETLFDSGLADSTTPTTTNTVNITLPGNWSNLGTDQNDILTGSFSIDPDFTITNDFTYNVGLNETLFQAIDTGAPASPNVSFIMNGVPEPGNSALLASLALSGLGFAARLRRRAR